MTVPTTTKQRFPWEPVPVEETVQALQRDLAFAIRYTAVIVHSDNAMLRLCANTTRGQIVPAGKCHFTDGTYVEFQDLGMPQPQVPIMSIEKLVSEVLVIARNFGLELAT